MHGYLSADIICFEKQTTLEKNCELRGTDNVQGQISEHNIYIYFGLNGGYCLYYPSNLFRNARNFQNWGIFSDIRSRDAFKPIARERKDLMDYNLGYSPVLAGEYSLT